MAAQIASAMSSVMNAEFPPQGAAPADCIVSSRPLTD